MYRSFISQFNAWDSLSWTDIHLDGMAYMAGCRTPVYIHLVVFNARHSASTGGFIPIVPHR